MRVVERFPFIIGSALMNLIFFFFGSWRTFQAPKKVTRYENGGYRVYDEERTVSMMRSWWQGKGAV